MQRSTYLSSSTWSEAIDWGRSLAIYRLRTPPFNYISEHNIREKATLWQLVGGVATMMNCTLLSTLPVFAQQQLLTDDLGHTDWEEVEPGHYIAADLIEHDGNTVVFDMLGEFHLQYTRLEGDCEAVRVQELRLGGMGPNSSSDVVFGDLSDNPNRNYDASEGQPYHPFLSVACQKRDSLS